MTATNHALTGALIGLSVSNPLLAAPLAFASHFALDMIPHYDQPETDVATRISARRFLLEQIVLGAGLCFALVLGLALTHPKHWLVAALCAFLAASPDLFWLPRFLHARRTGTDRPPRHPFLRFHERIQWKTAQNLIWVEAVWFVAAGGLVVHHL